MKSWNDLSMADRAKYIKLGVDQGIRNIDHIRSAYNKYGQGGFSEQQEQQTVQLANKGYENITGFSGKIKLVFPDGTTGVYNNSIEAQKELERRGGRAVPTSTTKVTSNGINKDLAEVEVIGRKESNQDHYSNDPVMVGILNGEYNGRKFEPTEANIKYFTDLYKKDQFVKQGWGQDQWAKVLAGHLLAGIAAYPAAPCILGAANLWGAYEGVKGLYQGIPRTMNHVLNGEYVNAAKSLIGNVFDGLAAAPAVGPAVRATRIAAPYATSATRATARAARGAVSKNARLAYAMEDATTPTSVRNAAALMERGRFEDLLTYPSASTNAPYFHRTTAPWNTTGYGTWRNFGAPSRDVFLSYGRPWMEFEWAPTIHEFPYSRVGRLSSTDAWGYPTGIDVRDVYRGYTGPRITPSPISGGGTVGNNINTGYQTTIPTGNYSRLMQEPHITHFFDNITGSPSRWSAHYDPSLLFPRNGVGLWDGMPVYDFPPPKLNIPMGNQGLTLLDDSQFIDRLLLTKSPHIGEMPIPTKVPLLSNSYRYGGGGKLNSYDNYIYNPYANVNLCLFKPKKKVNKFFVGGPIAMPWLVPPPMSSTSTLNPATDPERVALQQEAIERWNNGEDGWYKKNQEDVKEEVARFVSGLSAVGGVLQWVPGLNLVGEVLQFPDFVLDISNLIDNPGDKKNQADVVSGFLGLGNIPLFDWLNLINDVGNTIDPNFLEEYWGGSDNNVQQNKQSTELKKDTTSKKK